jgi:hypothetical protein
MSLNKNKQTNFSKKWILAGLALTLVFAVGGSVFYTMNQKISKSKASLCKPNEKGTSCVKPKQNMMPKPTIKKPLIQPNTPVIAPDEINPYTGIKQ